MKTIREIQEAAGDLWPDIDNALNEVRIDAAASTQATLAEQNVAHEKALTDKDTAHEATIANMRTEHDSALAKLTEESKAALDSQKIASDTAAKTVADNHEEARAGFADALARVRTDADAAITERDALAAKLVELSALQTELAKQARAGTGMLRQTLTQSFAQLDRDLARVEGIADAANKTADERAKDEAAQQLADAEALVAKLKGGA